MRTQPHPTVQSAPTLSYGACLMLLWLASWAMLLSSCATLDGLRQWSADKGQQLAKCQLQDIASKEQAEACLGGFARDLGTKGCKETQAWLDTLPGPATVDTEGESE